MNGAPSQKPSNCSSRSGGSRRRVSFHSQVEVRNVPCHHDLEHQVHAALWIQKTEYKAMKAATDSVVEMMILGRQHCTDAICIRGLELKEPQRGQRRKEAVIASIQAVVREQTAQRQEGQIDQALLARVYGEISSRSQDFASFMGLKDEREVQQQGVPAPVAGGVLHNQDGQVPVVAAPPIVVPIIDISPSMRLRKRQGRTTTGRRASLSVGPADSSKSHTAPHHNDMDVSGPRTSTPSGRVVPRRGSLSYSGSMDNVSNVSSSSPGRASRRGSLSLSGSMDNVIGLSTSRRRSRRQSLVHAPNPSFLSKPKPSRRSSLNFGVVNNNKNNDMDSSAHSTSSFSGRRLRPHSLTYIPNQTLIIPLKSQQQKQQLSRRATSVRFSPHVSEREIEHVGDLTDKEKEELWYTSKETMEIKRDRRMTVQRANSNNDVGVSSDRHRYRHDDDNNNDENECFYSRGFENLIGNDTVRRDLHQKVMKSKEAVLNEQRRQASVGISDPEQLSLVYQTATAHFVQVARQLGERDEKQVVDQLEQPQQRQKQLEGGGTSQQCRHSLFTVDQETRRVVRANKT